MTEKEKMLAGKIYDPSDKELVGLRTKAHRLSKEYNELLETCENYKRAWDNRGCRLFSRTYSI